MRRIDRLRLISQLRLPFGKYEGRAIGEVPLSYVENIASDFRESWLQRRLVEVLDSDVVLSSGGPGPRTLYDILGEAAPIGATISHGQSSSSATELADRIADQAAKMLDAMDDEGFRALCGVVFPVRGCGSPAIRNDPIVRKRLINLLSDPAVTGDFLASRLGLSGSELVIEWVRRNRTRPLETTDT